MIQSQKEKLKKGPRSVSALTADSTNGIYRNTDNISFIDIRQNDHKKSYIFSASIPSKKGGHHHPAQNRLAQNEMK